jgi:hypothetical protein
MTALSSSVREFPASLPKVGVLGTFCVKSPGAGTMTGYVHVSINFVWSISIDRRVVLLHQCGLKHTSFSTRHRAQAVDPGPGSF